jgi:hypothetical protein
VFAAARRVQAEHPTVRFLVVGPTDLDKADAITQAELDAAAADGVTFLGMRDDVEQLYPARDRYVLASHRGPVPSDDSRNAAVGTRRVARRCGCRLPRRRPRPVGSRGLPVLVGLDWLTRHDDVAVVPAIGSPARWAALLARLATSGAPLATVVQLKPRSTGCDEPGCRGTGRRRGRDPRFVG